MRSGVKPVAAVYMDTQYTVNDEHNGPLRPRAVMRGNPSARSCKQLLKTGPVDGSVGGSPGRKESNSINAKFRCTAIEF